MANVKQNYDLPNTRGPAKKIYLPIYVNKFRIIGIVDCGADITIIQKSLYDKIKRKSTNSNETLLPTDIENIYSFSNHTIPILGRKAWKVCLSHNHPGFKMNVYVIPANPNVPELLGTISKG